MEEDGNECSEDTESCCRDADCVEDECRVESGIKGIETVLDLRRPLDTAEVDVEIADFEFVAELLGDVEVV